MAYDDLMRAIHTTRRRWRTKMLLRGLAIVLGAGFSAFALSVWAMDTFRYSDAAVQGARVLVWVALAALVVRFLIVPLARRVTDRQVALYVEEQEPTLQAELLSAIELGRQAGDGKSPGASDRLVAQLLEKAILSCQALDYGASIERGGLRRGSAMVAAVAMAGFFAVLLSPAFLRHGALLLFAPWRGAALENPYSIEVLPGDVTVARGADQEVRARLVGFDAPDAELAVRRGEDEWERWPMTEGEPGEKVLLLLDLQDASEYYVEADGVSSALHLIEVADLPYVEQVALEYHFPDYTGLSVRRVEDGGDIAALRGTEVRLEITPTVAVSAGRLVLEGEEGGEQYVGLEAGEGGVLLARIDVNLDTFYRIDLQGPTGEMLSASPEFIVEVLDDQPPVLSFSTPGRDVRAHKLEEVFTEVSVEDDYGVARVDLHFSVNGEEEQKLRLLGGRAQTREAQLGHTFFLEELELQDGDFISYYASARDRGVGNGSRPVTTDIYFLEINPFTKNYRQAQQGAGGMGGGGQMDNALSKRQREIIAATFKLVRDEDEYSRKDFDENLTTVALMQGRLREQVGTLTARMGNRMRGEDDFQSIIENLERAAEEMVPAEEKLVVKKPDEALPPEQRALKFLQRAEATFRDVQVSFQQGGQGGQAQRMAEDLANLFELELDKLHNQYETVQRGERQEMQEEVDEALQKLQELARRQEQENERAKRMASRMGGAAGGRAQRDLIEETEELARKLERLARERSRPDLRETARRLQDAADAMKQASADRRGGEIGQGMQALDELERARRLLERNREFQLASEMEDLEERAQRARRLQERIQQEVSQLDPAAGEGAGSERMEQILEQKDELGREVGELESQIDRVARQARSGQKDAARRLGEASESIRENQLKEKIRYSKGVVRGRSPEYAERFENEISSDLDEMNEKLAEAGKAVGRSSEDQQAKALENARDLVRRLESFESRLQDRGQERQAQQGGESSSQEEGSQQAQEGQQGGQQGQEGSEQGQSGQQGAQQAQGGQQGQQSGGQQGGPAGGGMRTQMGQGGAPGWYQPGIFTPDDLRQMGSEFERRLGEAQDLRQELRALDVPVEDLEEVLNRMRDFNVRGINNDPLALEGLRAEIIEGLRQFEYRLWRELEGDAEQRLYLAGADEVPPGYRELVERYYQGLSDQ
jgi:hypothetical protein